ncbi:cytidyltransferase-related domain protein [Archaeoglobus sulfaticallidus PM70-1]|uniref:Phosphopantetheine adenylyltransferase n=1 Tax=Archaeoglobus sulfaticallidus PM70-1 TaxID=387631 RepID=N0BI95_9EURY|nr:phosphopantetheine adenylyltransferase [Archaeoglobus sulfaticallidus]AGK60181.1 cytidyltransferase-related domain protein [Archaeoglobus sulfaticallidus PM70-1]
MKVALGGTFEPLHEGHKKLIDVAIQLGGKEVMIGITSDEMARLRIRSVLPFRIRAENVRRYVLSKYGFEPSIVKIDSPYGRTLDVDFDYLVVSPETCKMAELINRKRRELGKKEIRIVKVDFLLAEDGKPISSTRIKRGEIDRYGNLI